VGQAGLPRCQYREAGENEPVTTEYAGAGDPKRTLELLWGLQERSKRGPKPRLTVEQIVRTAISVADTEGLAALSIRRVAEELGVSPMSLYTYIPGKAELLDLMLDTVYAETARPPHVPGQWRASLTQIALENWALYQRHPWLLQVAISRPPMGPHVMGKYEYELRAIEGLGLTDIEMDAVLTLIINYVHGAVRTAIDAAQAEQRTGMSDEQWWAAHAPLLEKIVDDSQYPVGSRVGKAVGEAFQAVVAPDFSFRFGLERILDGIEVLIASRQAK